MTQSSINSQEQPALTTPPPTMPAVVARRYGLPDDVVSIDEIPVPTPGRDEVLIQIEASSLNALDWHYLTGTPYFMRIIAGLFRPKRIIPGADLAGTVVAVGADVDGLKPGDSVFGECEGGGCSSFLAAKASSVVPIPAGVSFTDAAATPVAGLTALQGLRTHGDTQPGDHVLINGAAGGVGTFAVQLAKALGAHVTAVCSTRNVEMVRSIGADEVVDYTTDDFVPGGPRFDVMLDGVGNRSADEILSILKPGARYVVISGPKDNRWLGPVPKIVRTGLRMRRADLSFHQFTASPNHEDLSILAKSLASGQVVPQIQRIIGLDGVADALAEIGTGHTRAKIVVVPAGPANLSS